MNEAFEMLRQHTSTSSNHRLPKVEVTAFSYLTPRLRLILQVEILRNAISYIQSLEKCLGISLEDERKENVVKIVNSTFQPLQDYFNYERLTGYHAGDETYHVGSIAKHLSQLVQTLPDIGIVPKLTWLWHFIIKGEQYKS